MFDAYQHASRLFSEKLNLNPHYLYGSFFVLTNHQTLDQKSVSDLKGSEKKIHTFTER